MKDILIYALLSLILFSCSEPIDSTIIDDTSGTITNPDGDKKGDIEYTLSTEIINTTLNARVGHNAIYFKDAFWIYGGHKPFNDSTTNDILKSEDGITWTKVKDHAPWTGREKFNLFVYKDKLWLISGKSNRDTKGNEYTAKDDYTLNRLAWPGDVWNSEDGINWNKVIAHGPWETRLGASVGVFKDKMYLIGGQSLTNWHLYQDIYQSTDGLNWNKVSSIPDKTIGTSDSRQGIANTTLIEYKDKFILFGGVRASAFNRMDWVLSSTDALNWTVANKILPWETDNSLHNEFIQPILFKDKIWIVYYNVLYKSNDGIHWTKNMELPTIQDKQGLYNPRAIVKDNSIYLYGSYLSLFGTRDTTMHIVKITAK